MAIFPKEMTDNNLTLDVIKAKFNYFELQIHELHWQTKSFAEHEALGDLYNIVFTAKDDFVEKIMGYTGIRTKAMPVDPIQNYTPEFTIKCVRQLHEFAYQLELYGSKNNYCDIENMAQTLSGDAAKILYRLTLN